MYMTLIVKFIGIYLRYQLSVYRTIGPLVLYVYCEYPDYNTDSLITQSVSIDLKDNVIMRLSCKMTLQKIGIMTDVKVFMYLSLKT